MYSTNKLFLLSFSVVMSLMTLAIWLWFFSVQATKAQAPTSSSPQWYDISLPVPDTPVEAYSGAVYDNKVAWSQDGACGPIIDPSGSPLNTLTPTQYSKPQDLYTMCLYDIPSDTMTWLGSHALQIEVDEKWLIYAWSYDSIPCGGAVSGISARNLKEDPQKDILIWNFGCSIFVYLEAIQADANVVVASIPMENRLEAYDLETATFTTIIDDPSYLVGDFDIWNNIVVWGQSPTDTIEYDIMGYDLTIQQPFTVSAKPGSEGDISVDNDIIVWTWNGNVYGYDLSISERFTITTESQARPLLELSGDWLVWRDDRNGEWDIYSMNIRTGQEYRVTEETGHYFNPTIDGSLIVWTAGKSPAGPFQAVRVEAVRRLDHFAFLPVVSRE